MSDRFRDELLAAAGPLWDEVLSHPFVEQLHAGSLDRESFAFFVGQDYQYLKRFARALCLAGAKGDTLAVTELFAVGAANVVRIEEALHGVFGDALGLTIEDLEDTPPAPVTVAYTDHLLAATATGTLAEAVAAVLPCYWIYREVGVARASSTPDDPLYAQWIEAYASPTFSERVDAQLDLIDRLGPECPTGERQRVVDRFVTSCRYEQRFWTQALERSA